VDTRLDIEPNTLLQLSATGQVDVAAGWGLHGPEGTTDYAPLAGYPAETRMRYGLVARLTAGPTSPEEDLSETWAYLEPGLHFAAQGGHLWLTVNDDNPDDNSGFFKVHLEQTTFPTPEKLCHPCPDDEITLERVIGKPLPDPKAPQTLLVLDGEIFAVNQSGGATLVTVSRGSMLTKYGDLPNLKIVFKTDSARPASTLSKEGVIQGVVFQNNKMSLITGASRLVGKKEGKQ
jgi:hypothetical protein